MRYFAYFTWGFIALIGILALSWVSTGNDFFLYKFFAPKQENVRRQVFENTQSYVQGKADYISQLRLEYESADPKSESVHRAALRNMILTQALTVDNDKLPADEQRFISDLRSTR